jgi:hypothetical protein
MNEKQPSRERRVGEVAIPDDIRARLNELQHQTLSRVEGFGWSVGFVRRPLFQDQVVVLFDSSGKQYAILNEDGTIDRTSEIVVR